jgi:type II secretory pathway pseudopilin PulG
MRGSESGAALLETIVAVAILATAGTAAVAMASEAARAVERARDMDRRVREASAFVDAVALWPRADLDRRLGERRQGRWHLRLDRPSDELYTVVLVDSISGAEILRTALFRPDTADGIR